MFSSLLRTLKDNLEFSTFNSYLVPVSFPLPIHHPSDSQLEQNARNRRPSLSPIIIRQQEQEQKAKMAASAPVDITQVMSKLSQQGKEAPPRRTSVKND